MPPRPTLLSTLVEDRFGLKLQPNLHALLTSAAEALVARGVARDLDEVHHRLQHADAADAVVDGLRQAASITETWFFRGRAQLEALAQVVARNLPATKTRVTVWSAGCATGEEAYSLAALFRRALPRVQVWVLGTDMNQASLRIAERAVYRGRAFREVPPEEMADVVMPEGDAFVVRKAVRDCVTFEVLNLVTDAYPSAAHPLAHFDVVVCRNVLIYLDPQGRATVMERFAQCTAPRAVLALALAEHSAGALAPGFASLGQALYGRQLDWTPRPSQPVTAPRPSSPAWAPAPPVRPSPAPLPSPLDEARLAIERKDFATARVRLADVLAERPDDAHAFVVSSQLHSALGEVDQALDHARRAVFLERESAAAQWALAHAMNGRGQRRKARVHLQKAIKLLEPLAGTATVSPLGLSVEALRALLAAGLQEAS